MRKLFYFIVISFSMLFLSLPAFSFDGDSKESNLKNVAKVFKVSFNKNLSKKLAKIKVYNFTMKEDSLVFRVKGQSVRLDWNLEKKLVYLNGQLISEDDYSNKKQIKKKISKILGTKKRKRSIASVILIPEAEAFFSSGMGSILTQLIMSFLGNMFGGGQGTGLASLFGGQQQQATTSPFAQTQPTATQQPISPFVLQ